MRTAEQEEEEWGSGREEWSGNAVKMRRLPPGPGPGITASANGQPKSQGARRRRAKEYDIWGEGDDNDAKRELLEKCVQYAILRVTYILKVEIYFA